MSMRSPTTFVFASGGQSRGRSSASTPPSQSGRDRRPKLQVLLVSGKPTEREQWRSFLSDPEFQVSTADNGRAALRAIQAGGIDLVIAAVMIEEMDGIELVRSASTINDAPPIIVVARGHGVLDYAYLR